MTQIAGTAPATRFDVHRLRKDFPILQQTMHGRPLVYLDNANTTQKPRAVLDAMQAFYETYNANIHRATYLLSERATDAYEGTRHAARRFVNAADHREIVLTKGSTDGINLVAQSWGRSTLRPGDEVVISWLEHHSNIVPWQLVCEQTGARLRVAPIDDRGEIILDELDRMLNERTRMVAVGHVSNALGTINPVEDIIRRAHDVGARVLVDGAQAAAHLPIDVRALDADFYVFSGHKMFGPTGTGVLYGKAELLERMPPYQGGGDMIESVTFEKTTYNAIPYKFEAGTPNIAGVIGLGAAIKYLEGLDRAAARAHEDELLAAATARLDQMPGVRLIGRARRKSGVVSFVIDGVHPHDIGTVLDREGVAIRTGQHCAQPVMDRYGVAATARASFALYNTHEEIEALLAAVAKAAELLT
ncbi:MAG TPA: cysteine desulfurase [Vicinamibacterales bacterium]|nr:cysteine desulfurase [Vicinamibacterales bacterium]